MNCRSGKKQARLITRASPIWASTPTINHERRQWLTWQMRRRSRVGGGEPRRGKGNIWGMGAMVKINKITGTIHDARLFGHVIIRLQIIVTFLNLMIDIIHFQESSKADSQLSWVLGKMEGVKAAVFSDGETSSELKSPPPREEQARLETITALGAEFEPEVPTLIDVTMFLSENHRRRWYNGTEMLWLLENLSVRISVFLQTKNENEAMKQDRPSKSSLKMTNLGGKDGSV
ncbi:hypothetical protein IW261DRAFT_1428934 [Armillaria novae-zelandiae]|uniref:Uncharacterized protein n=1 Tax=Armillaria novae-zelandiae TaxID=153914 RepID=A0AA39KJ44_9AGAR|nr:hypothetical protein IW261DRAFT_1428934 [Armillaria novae-zelandiae]